MYAVGVCSATLVSFFVFLNPWIAKCHSCHFLEVELATAILLVRPNCIQTDDNVTSGKSCFPFEARNGLFTGEQYGFTR